MALHADDLLEPAGELDGATLWPGVDDDEIADKLESYLDEGYSRAAAVEDAEDQDEAARQWAYHRAYKGVYQRLLTTPSTVSLNDEGSSSYLLTQIEHVGQLATEALVAHEALVEVATGTVAEFPAIRSFRR